MAHQIDDHVAETSTTTGTGDFTLAGAITGFRTFASVCATNDTFDYEIAAVDANGNRTSEWEVGRGTYSAANTLTRTQVIASSNAGAAVTFSAGTKQVSMTRSGLRLGLHPAVILSSNVICSAVALADIGNLNFDAEVSALYMVEIRGIFQSAATTTGMSVALNIPSGTVAGLMHSPTSTNGLGGTHQTTDDAVSGATTGVIAANTNYPFFYQGIVNIGATGGVVQARGRSEIAASNITFQSSLCFMVINRIA